MAPGSGRRAALPEDLQQLIGRAGPLCAERRRARYLTEVPVNARVVALAATWHGLTGR